MARGETRFSEDTAARWPSVKPMGTISLYFVVFEGEGLWISDGRDGILCCGQDRLEVSLEVIADSVFE